MNTSQLTDEQLDTLIAQKSQQQPAVNPPVKKGVSQLTDEDLDKKIKELADEKYRVRPEAISPMNIIKAGAGAMEPIRGTSYKEGESPVDTSTRFIRENLSKVFNLGSPALAAGNELAEQVKTAIRPPTEKIIEKVPLGSMGGWGPELAKGVREQVIDPRTYLMGLLNPESKVNKVIEYPLRVAGKAEAGIGTLRGKGIPALAKAREQEIFNETRAIEDERLGVKSQVEDLSSQVEKAKQESKLTSARQIAEENARAKEEIDNLSAQIEKSKTESKLASERQIAEEKGTLKAKTENIGKNLQTAIDQASIEGKKRFPQMRREISNAYGNYRNKILQPSATEKIIVTQDDLTNFISNIDTDIEKSGINSGKALKAWQDFKSKYVSGNINEIVNPELKKIYEGLNLNNKAQVKNAGINWKQVSGLESSGGVIPETKPISAKEFLDDLNKVEDAISAKAKGASQQFTNEDRVAAIVQHHTDNLLENQLPALKKLRQVAAPILDLKNNAAGIIKTGNQWDIDQLSGLIEKVVSGKANPKEIEMLNTLQKGQVGFTKGIGNIVRTPQKISKIAAQRGQELELLGARKPVETIPQDLITALQEKQKNLELTGARKPVESIPTDLAQALKEKQNLAELIRARKPAEETSLSKALEEAKLKKIPGLNPLQLLSYFIKRRLFAATRGKIF